MCPSPSSQAGFQAIAATCFGPKIRSTLISHGSPYPSPPFQGHLFVEETRIFVLVNFPNSGF
jgi:hypothetical protein